MATTTNYGWTTPDDTALVKDGASAIRTLGSSVDTTTKNLNPSTTLGDIEYRSSTANTNTRLAIGTTGQVLTVAGGVPSWATPAAPSTQTAVFHDQKAQYTGGGTFTSGAYRTRDLNTTQFNNITSCSLSSNQISLPAGTYEILGTACAFEVNRHQARLYNITDSSVTILGMSNFARPSADSQSGIATIQGTFTIAGTKTFEFQHICQTTKSGEGFGLQAEFNAEVYVQLTITKVG